MTFNPALAMAEGMSFGEASRRLREDVSSRDDNVVYLPAARLAANDNSRGPFITTFTGRFYPFSPRASEVNILDIAHGLANICRYSGQGRKNYVVAEHSVHVARAVYEETGSRTDALAGLLHDAPEALSGFGDVGSPVKVRVPLISQVEARIFVSIAAYSGIAPIIPPIVHEIDARITADEMSQNMRECPVMHEPLGIHLKYWSHERAEEEFLKVWNLLGGGDAI